MPLSVSVKGVEENIDALRRVNAQAKDTIVQVLREEVQKAVDDAKSRAPVDTGALRDGITRSVSKKNLTATMSAGGKRRGVDTYYAYFIEFGTKNMPARPFFYPAARAHEEEIAERLGDEMYLLISKEVEK